MADIPINEVTRRVQFTGNTTTGPFAFTFNILDDDDLVVYKNFVLQTITTDYTVSTNANGTGSITMTTALVASDVLTIIGGRALERTTDFVTAGDLLASSLNEQLDSLVIMAQQLDEKLDRSVKVDIGDQFTDLSLPAKADRLGAVLAFNATSGDPEAGPLIGDVSSIADITADISLLADIEDGTLATNAITNVNTIRTDVTTVAANNTNVTTVANNDANITTVATNDANITIVANAITDVSTVSNDIAQVIIAANDLNEAVSEIDTVANAITNVDTVGTNIASVNTVAGEITPTNNISTVAGIASDVSTVATANTNVGTVATDIANVNTVAGQITPTNNISTVAGISTEIAAVAGDATDIGTVAADLAGSNTIGTVAGDISNVNAVAGNSTNINAVAGNATNINAVAADATDIGTVATDLAGSDNIGTVAGSITNVNTVATNITGVNSFAERYRVGATDPTTDLDEGDLFFNTTDNAYKFYDGTQWNTVNVSGIASVVEDTTPQLGGVLASNGNNIEFGDSTGAEVNRLKFGAGDDLEIYHNGTHNYIEAGSTTSTDLIITASDDLVIGHGTAASYETMATFLSDSSVNLYYNNSAKLATQNTGVYVTGDLTTSDDLFVNGGFASVSSSTTPVFRLINTDTTASSNQELGTIDFYGSDTSTPGAGIKSSIAAHATGILSSESYLKFSNSTSSGNDLESVRIQNYETYFYNGHELRIFDSDNTNTVGIAVPTDVTSTHTITLPAAGPSAADQILVSDASGNLSFEDKPTAGGTAFSAF